LNGELKEVAKWKGWWLSRTRHLRSLYIIKKTLLIVVINVLIYFYQSINVLKLNLNKFQKMLF